MRVDVNALLHEEYKRLLKEKRQSVHDLIDLALDMATSDFSDVDALNRQARKVKRLNRQMEELRRRQKELICRVGPYGYARCTM